MDRNAGEEESPRVKPQQKWKEPTYWEKPTPCQVPPNTYSRPEWWFALLGDDAGYSN